MKRYEIISALLLAFSAAPIGTSRLTNEIGPFMKYDKVTSSSFSPTDRQDVIFDSDGTKILRVRWAVGTRENITTLHVPFTYADPMTLADCLTIGSESTTQCKLPFEVELLLRAELPDFRPQNPKPENEHYSTSNVGIFLRSFVLMGKGPNLREAIRGLAQTSMLLLKLESGQNRLNVGRKTSIYGLNRIGLLHDNVGPDASHLHEIYFDGSSPEESQNIMVCTELAAPTRLRNPNTVGVPSCKQYIMMSDLSAIAEISYERQYLSDWNTIKQNATKLMYSFTYSPK